MNVIRNPKHHPAPGDRLLRNGVCRLVVSVEHQPSNTSGMVISAVRWVNGHHHKTLHAVPAHARDTAYSSTAGAWRAWAKDGATVLSEVKVS